MKHREVRISWNSLKEIFHSVSSPLQGHLEYVMHTFDKPNLSISRRFPMQKKGFSLFSLRIV